MSVSKAVLITGCSSGIGRATAERLARAGHTVYATARRVESIEDLGGLGCRLLSLDVTDDESMAAAVKEIETAEGSVGAVVNNAGYSQGGAIETLTPDALRRQFETNVFGLVRLTQLCLPGMRAQGWGRIVNVSSVGGRLSLPGGGAYHATKWAVEALSDTLRYEVAPFGIKVSVIEPGVVPTRFVDHHSAAIEETADDPAYAAFNAGVRERVERAYEGGMAKLGSSPDRVAKAIQHAVESRRPKTRYVVGADARTAIILRSILPDRAYDAVMRTQYPVPGAPA